MFWSKFVAFAGLAVRLLFVNAESSVIELSVDDFDVKTKSGTWLVEFYGPTCGFCKMLEPEWEKLAKEVKEDELDMHVAKVNVREAQELSQRFNIGKLPGIKLFKDGQVYTLPDARRTRTQDEYIEYAMETYEQVEKEEAARVAEEERKEADIEARSKVIKLTVDNFEETVAEGNWLIEFYGPKCGYCKKLAPVWEQLGELVNSDPSLDFKVAKIDAAAGFVYTRQFKANPWPAIKLLRDGLIYTYPEPRNFEKTPADYVRYATETYKADEVAVEGETRPIVPEFMENAKKRKERKAKYGKWKKGGEKGGAAAHDEL